MQTLHGDALRARLRSTACIRANAHPTRSTRHVLHRARTPAAPLHPTGANLIRRRPASTRQRPACAHLRLHPHLLPALAHSHHANLTRGQCPCQHTHPSNACPSPYGRFCLARTPAAHPPAPRMHHPCQRTRPHLRAPPARASVPTRPVRSCPHACPTCSAPRPCPRPRPLSGPSCPRVPHPLLVPNYVACPPLQNKKGKIFFPYFVLNTSRIILFALDFI